MTKHFITILNGVITGRHHGDFEADFYGTEFYGHDRMEVPADAEITVNDRPEYFEKGWKRKSDCQLIDEGKMKMPKGYVREGDKLRAMTREERIISGLDVPPAGFKVSEGKIIEMTLQEKRAAGLMTEEEYNKQLAVNYDSELQRRLAELQTPEALAEAEIYSKYANERRQKLVSLLMVKKQPGWPLSVTWPKG